MKQLFSNKQKKNNKKLYLENKRREAIHQPDIEHKQSQLLLQHRDRAHQAQEREAHLDHMMEEYRNDLGEGYIPFISMIDINSNEQLPRPRPEQQRQTTLPLQGS